MRHINYNPRTCLMCALEYKPTSSRQKFCKPCGKQNRRDYALAWYYKNNGREYSREYARERSDTFVCVEDYVSIVDFRKSIVDTIVNRKGSMLSTKTTMRRILRHLGIYESSWLQKRNRGGLALSFYAIIHEEFKKHGGVYFATSTFAGDQYQFPLKERKK